MSTMARIPSWMYSVFFHKRKIGEMGISPLLFSKKGQKEGGIFTVVNTCDVPVLRTFYGNGLGDYIFQSVFTFYHPELIRAHAFRKKWASKWALTQFVSPQETCS